MVNCSVALVTLMVAAGPAVIVTTGSTVSVRQVASWGAETLPAGSVARTRRVWVPSARSARDHGDEHEAHSWVSSLHSTAAVASSTLNVTVAEVWLVGLVGAPVMVTTGAVASTVQVRAAAGPVLPAASTAYTLNVCRPGGRLPRPWGDVQTAGTALSSAQRNVTSVSFAVKVNVRAPRSPRLRWDRL